MSSDFQPTAEPVSTATSITNRLRRIEDTLDRLLAIWS